MKYIQFTLLFFPVFLFAQNNTWKNYSTSTMINEIAYHGTDTWIATDGGVVQYNTITGETNFYDRANSELPFNNITSIAIDQNGTRWLGTYVGLVRWDGNDMTYITPNQPVRIRKLGMDKDGFIWMHIDYAQTPLASYHPSTGWKVYNISTLLGNDQVLRAIQVNPNLSGVYFYTSKSNISRFYHYDGLHLSATDAPVDPNEPSQSLDISTWEIDAEGKFWFVDDNKLYHKSATDWEVETTPIWADEMVFDIDNKILMGDHQNELYRRESQGQYTDMNMASVTLGYNFRFSVSPTNELWTLDGGKLLKKNNQAWTPIRTSAFDIPNNQVVELMVTGQQKIWGAFDHNIWGSSNGKTVISTFENQTWEFSQYDGYINGARDLAKDKNDRVLVANWGCLQIYDGSWKTINAVNYPYDPIISVACQSGTDQIWVGGFDYIGKIENNTYQQIPLPPGGNAEKIAVDHNGWVWIRNYEPGTGNCGLAYYNGSEWHFVARSALAYENETDIIRDLSIAPDGKLFVVGAFDIVYFDGVFWHNAHIPPYFGEFEAIAFDGADHFWVATSSINCFDVPIPDFGLFESDHGVIQHYKFKDHPLPHSNISALAVDGYHNVWIGCDQGGIAVYNKDGVIVGTESPTPSTNKMTAIAYPNPTHGNTTLEFDVIEKSDIQLRVFDNLGRQVVERVLLQVEPNHFQWVLEKSKIGTGCFYWSITTSSGQQTGKVIFMD